MLGFSRLSDLFNNAPGEFLGAFTYMASTASPGGVIRRDLVVRLRDVRLVRPIDEAPTAVDLSLQRNRVPARVVLDLDDWQITGEIHLVDRVRWLDFAMGAPNRFISVNKAAVRFVGVADPLECDYLLVNGARISALYEMV